METGTKPQSGRATDRVLEALSTLYNLLDRTINEVKTLDTDFQNRLRQSVHETEASLQSQAAEHLELALNETRTKLEEEFSKRVAELSSQGEEERNQLKSEFAKMAGIAAQGEEERNQLKSELAKMSGIAGQGEEERNRLKAELARMSGIAGQGEEERNRLKAELARMNGMAAQGEEERNRLKAELAKMRGTTAQWEEERNQLKAEVAKMTGTTSKWEAERARLNGELQHLAKVQAATQAEAERAIMALKAANAASQAAKPSMNSPALNNEIDRVQVLIKTLSDLIEDPASELSIVIRKNVERAELEAYLKGIRYALNGAESK